MELTKNAPIMSSTHATIRALCKLMNAMCNVSLSMRIDWENVYQYAFILAFIWNFFMKLIKFQIECMKNILTRLHVCEIELIRFSVSAKIVCPDEILSIFSNFTQPIRSTWSDNRCVYRHYNLEIWKKKHNFFNKNIIYVTFF